MSLRVRRSHVILSAALLALSACGAGAVSAAILGSRRNNGGATQVTLTVSPGSGPLAITAGTLLQRTAVLRGRRVPSGATLELRLSWNDGGTVVEDVQLLGRIDSTGSEVSIDFALTTADIAARAGDPRTRDLDVELLALARFDATHVEVLARTPYRLLRQPALALVPNRPDLGISLVPVSGGDIEMTVDDLPTSDPRDLSVEIVTLDPNPPVGSDPLNPPVIRSQATNLRTEADPNLANRTLLTCTAPPATIANDAFVLVRHNLGGLTNAIGDVYYRPELTAVVARRASTRGGDLLTLTGRALIPFDFTVVPPRPDIGRVQLSVIRGNQTVGIPTSDLRPALSTVNSIVFLAPPSPDGRPGPATVRLLAQLLIPIATDGVGLLAYGSANADLEPRGIGLGQSVVAAAYGPRDSAATDRAADAAVLFADASAVPFVQVFESQGNGMFGALGIESPAGDRIDPDQRDPLDLVWADFHGDALGDLFVLNGGGSRSGHTLLRGTANPGRPLGASALAFRTLARPARARAASFDGDTLTDLLVVGSVQAERTTEIARATTAGSFVNQPVFSSPVPLLQAETVADLDGDGALDLAFAVGGASARLMLAFGDGMGAFPDRREVDLSAVSGIADLRAIGIHAVGPRPDRALALVLADTVASAHALFLLMPTGPRDYMVAPVITMLGAGAPTASLGVDLDGDDAEELVVARSASAPALFVWQAGGFVEQVGAVHMSAADAGDIVALRTQRAVDSARGPRDAVFVLHRTSSVRADPMRITTLLVGPGPQLLDARAELILAQPARKVSVWASGAGTAACDVAIAFDNEIALSSNDGVGGLEDSSTHSVPGLVESSLCSCRPDGGASPRLMFLLDDGHVGQLDSQAPAPVFSTTSLILGLGTILPASRIVAGDVDADGLLDLVVLAVIDRTGGEIERRLVLLRGRAPGTDPFGFAIPQSAAWTDLGSEVADVAVGDFAPTDPDGYLEVAVAIPRTDAGRGVRFFRYEPGSAEDRWSLVSSVVSAADPALAATFDPGLLRVADLDADGFDDLLIASSTLDVLQVFRQTGVSTRTTAHPEDVDPLMFVRTSDVVMPSGTPEAMHLGDLDGDLVPDVVIQVRRRSDPNQHAIEVAVSNGLAGFARSFELPAIDVGAGGPDMSTAVGDLNGDGQPDLALTFGGDGGALPSSIRMLFGVHR